MQLHGGGAGAKGERSMLNKGKEKKISRLIARYATSLQSIKYS